MLLPQLMSQVQTRWEKTFSLAVLPVGWISESLLTLPEFCPGPLALCPRAAWAHCCPWSAHQPGSTQAPVREMPPALLLSLGLLSAWQKDRSGSQIPAHLLPTAATHTPHSQLQQWLPQVSWTIDMNVSGQPDPFTPHPTPLHLPSTASTERGRPLLTSSRDWPHWRGALVASGCRRVAKVMGCCQPLYCYYCWH